MTSIAFGIDWLIDELLDPTGTEHDALLGLWLDMSAEVDPL